MNINLWPSQANTFFLLICLEQYRAIIQDLANRFSEAKKQGNAKQAYAIADKLAKAAAVAIEVEGYRFKVEGMTNNLQL